MAALQLVLVVFLAVDVAEQRQEGLFALVFVVVQVDDHRTRAQRQAAAPAPRFAGLAQRHRRQQVHQAPGQLGHFAELRAEQVAHHAVGQGDLAPVVEQQHAVTHAVAQRTQHDGRRKGRERRGCGIGHGATGRRDGRPL